MKLGFIFCHGFGFDARFWDHLIPYFEGQHCITLDLGYFGRSHLDIPQDPNMAWIGIGHSLGLIKLIQQPRIFRGLVGLNSFIHFLGHDPIVHRTRRHELNQLIRSFDNAPESTLNRFYQRCGISLDPCAHTPLTQSMLMADLHALSHPYTIPPHVPMLIIGAHDDVIVPPTLIQDNFAHHPHVWIDMLEKGRHSLGATHVAQIHQKIMGFYETQCSQQV